MGRFAPTLLFLTLIALGVVAIWTSPWELNGWTIPLAFLLVVVVSKVVAVVFAIRHSQAGD